MNQHQLEKRKKIMARSIALGHCVCDPAKPCPCPVFKDMNVCQCAGEKLPLAVEGEVRLTDYVKSAGCASKIGKKDLMDMLSGLPVLDDERVLVGSNAGDDAGVMVLSDNDSTAHILTVDVFAPSVDDPYTFGQIAAANSVSDIYAMGGTPQAALSVIGFPTDMLPNEVMTAILRGGIEKMKEAGVPVVGGHSIKDGEIKCGFAVLGTCPRDKFIRNQGARPGDVMILTKSLGVGITAFAGQIGKASEEQLADVAASMATLNRVAAETMLKHGVHAATDITGYSLLGHLSEIVKNSHIHVELDMDSIPLFGAVAELARMDVLPGAVERNKEAVPDSILDLTALAEAQKNILFAPETSGGLLMFIPGDQAEACLASLHDQGVSRAAIVGRVTGDHDGGLIQAVTSQKAAFSPVKFIPETHTDVKEVPMADTSCCGQSEDTLSCCASAEETQSAADTPTVKPSAGNEFMAYMGTVNQPGAISQKNKKLISLALSIVTKCEPCVKINTKAAEDAGATEAEVAEAAALGIAFGGAPAAMFYKTIGQAKKKDQ